MSAPSPTVHDDAKRHAPESSLGSPVELENLGLVTPEAESHASHHPREAGVGHDHDHDSRPTSGGFRTEHPIA